MFPKEKPDRDLEGIWGRGHSESVWKLAEGSQKKIKNKIGSERGGGQSQPESRESREILGLARPEAGGRCTKGGRTRPDTRRHCRREPLL